jgi:hypothetical protein
MTLAVDGQKHLIQMPLIARPRPSTPEPIRIVLPELPTPVADGVIGDVDAACEQELLHVTVAQVKAVVEPEPMADDVAGKAVVRERSGSAGGVISGCLARGCIGHVWGSTEVSMS